MAEPQKITAWSYSRWNCYEDCPRKAKYKFVDKRPEPGSTAMDRGSEIHKIAENFVLAPGARAPKVPSELAYYGAEFKLARKGKPVAEQEWAFTADWGSTGWFSKDAWCRVKTDLCFWRKDKLVIVDHKTGKRRDEHVTQLSLYALGGFIKFPVIDSISAEVWYLDQGKPITNAEFERGQLDDLKADWEKKTKAMLSDTIFAPRPSRACSWCHFRKENGGPCEF